MSQGLSHQRKTGSRHCRYILALSLSLKSIKTANPAYNKMENNEL